MVLPLGLIGSIGGSLISGLFGMKGQSSANQANMEMDSTKYQRASADMMAAGLNPAAMYNGGTPSSPPQMQNTMAAPAAAAKDAITSASGVAVAQKTIDHLTSQIAKQNADTANVKAALPSIVAGSDLASREAGAIKKIPDPVYLPIVQGGWGADKFKSATHPASIGGAAAASAKEVAKGIKAPFSGMSGPSLSSARELKRAWDTKSPDLFRAIEKWLEPYPRKVKPRTSVVYKNDY